MKLVLTTFAGQVGICNRERAREREEKEGKTERKKRLVDHNRPGKVA